MNAISDAVSNALVQGLVRSSDKPTWPTDHSTGLESLFLPTTDVETRQQDMHETLLIVPAAGGEQTPIELHIDNCHRRCVALYDTQQIVQFGG